jgi:uncharacterized protein
MTADDLSAPLGQQRKARRRAVSIPVAQIVAGALALFLSVFALWVIVADDPFGGEPLAIAPADLDLAATARGSEKAGVVASEAPAQPDTHQAAAAPAKEDAASQTKTITIIDGKTGARQDVVVPAQSGAALSSAGPPPEQKADQKFVEMTPQGAIPKIAADGTRPADAFAQPVAPLPGKPDAPRVALIVGGLGISASITSDAIAKLPGPVTLGFVPYGSDLASLAARARGKSHEVLLQVPMEPFDYPDNDPGPQTLLTSLTPQQNVDRLHALMGRLQGYVGVAVTMGARFTASEPSLAPILREVAKRGLIFVDNGANPRSIAGHIASANNAPFAEADVVVDSVATPAEIDHALDRLEAIARERGVAVGVSSALPVAVDHIAKWAKAAETRGLLLIPISAVAARGKQS